MARGSSRPKFEIKYPKVKPYYIHEKFMNIGKTKDIYEGQEINIFDKDRTICDVVRNAKKMRAESKVRTLIGMWL